MFHASLTSAAYFCQSEDTKADPKKWPTGKENCPKSGPGTGSDPSAVREPMFSRCSHDMKLTGGAAARSNEQPAEPRGTPRPFEELSALSLRENLTFKGCP